jgi:hypothetical protein
MTINPYESPEISRERGTSNIIQPFVIAIGVIVATIVLCVVAGEAALGGFIPSPDNLRDELLVGVFLGIPGGLAAWTIYASVETLKRTYTLAFATAWPVIVSVCFYLFISIYAIG